LHCCLFFGYEKTGDDNYHQGVLQVYSLFLFIIICSLQQFELLLMRRAGRRLQRNSLPQEAIAYNNEK